MFSTDISYDEAASAIQKLDPAMRADYEENLSRLRKAEIIQRYTPPAGSF